MALPRPRTLVSVAVATAVGAAAGYLQLHLGPVLPTSGAEWESMGLGAVLSAVIAVAHLYQDPNPPSGDG